MKISNTLLITKKIKTLTVCAKILALCHYIMYFVNIRTSHLARFLKHSKAFGGRIRRDGESQAYERVQNFTSVLEPWSMLYL